MTTMSGWALLYLATQLLLALGLGGLLARLPRALPVPLLARFYAGLSLAPFASGAWVMLCALLWPGIPHTVMALGLTGIALILFATGLRYLPARLARAWRAQPGLPGGRLTLLVLYGACAMLLAVLGDKLWRNALQPVAAHDALNYLSEALYFLDVRGLAGMLGMGDATDGSVRGTTHGFLFSAMLAGALSFTDGAPGWPGDLAARLALQLTIPSMLCALLALAALLRRRGAGALAIVLLLGVAQFEYVSHAASRDGFRIAPLLLFGLLLSGVSGTRARAGSLVLLAGSAALAVTAHTLNVMVVVVATAMCCVLAAWQRYAWTNVLSTLAAVAVGVLAASARYIASYRASGQLWGELPARYGLEGSVLDGAWQHLARYADSHALGAAQKIGVLLARDGGLLSAVGLLAAAALLLFRTGRTQGGAARLWALIALGLVAPLTGWFDIEPYRISDWFVENLRYTLHWYPWLALAVVACMLIVGERCAARGQKAARVMAVLSLLVVLAYSALALHTLSVRWRGEPARSAARQAFGQQLELLQKLNHELALGQRLCLDDVGYQYYLGNRALILGAKSSWPLLRAGDDTQVAARLDALAIGAVVFKKASLPGWYERLPLYQSLSSSPDWQVAGETRSLIAYQRVRSASRAASPR